MWTYRARIIDVIDSRTVDVEIDLGLHIRTDARVILTGVLAPPGLILEWSRNAPAIASGRSSSRLSATPGAITTGGTSATLEPSPHPTAIPSTITWHDGLATTHSRNGSHERNNT